MKQGRTLQQLAAELERQANAARDFKAPITHLSMKADAELGARLHVDSYGAYELTDNAHAQLATYTGIPQKYYDRMRDAAPELLSDNVNTWLFTHEPKNEQRLVRTLDNRVRGFLSNRYRVIDNYTVAEAVIPELTAHPGLRVESCEVTETKLYIKAVSTRTEASIVGSAVQAGIVISNSEVGAGAFKIEPLVYILICRNGAIIPDAGLRRFHIGRQTQQLDEAVEIFADDTRRADDRALMLKMRDTVRAAFDGERFKQLTVGLAVTAGNKVEAAPGAAVDAALEVLAIAPRHRDGLLAAFGREDATRWGLSNAITAYAQTVGSYEEATQLERAGGEVLVLPRTSWKEISEAVAA